MPRAPASSARACTSGSFAASAPARTRSCHENPPGSTYAWKPPSSRGRPGPAEDLGPESRAPERAHGLGFAVHPGELDHGHARRAHPTSSFHSRSSGRGRRLGQLLARPLQPAPPAARTRRLPAGAHRADRPRQQRALARRLEQTRGPLRAHLEDDARALREQRQRRLGLQRGQVHVEPEPARAPEPRAASRRGPRARPPSETSCAARTQPPSAAATASSCSRASRSRSSAGGPPASSRSTSRRKAEPLSSSRGSPTSTRKSPARSDAQPHGPRHVAQHPRAEHDGRGAGRRGRRSGCRGSRCRSRRAAARPRAASPPSASAATASPSSVASRSPITPASSGWPKFRQSVRAHGRAPTHATLRAASATAWRAPSSGSLAHQNGFPPTANGDPAWAAPGARGSPRRPPRRGAARCAPAPRCRSGGRDTRASTGGTTRAAPAAPPAGRRRAARGFARARRRAAPGRPLHAPSGGDGLDRAVHQRLAVPGHAVARLVRARAR